MRDSTYSILRITTVFLWAYILFAVITNCSYPNHAHPHGELALVGYKNTGSQTAPNAAFLCAESFGVRHSMVKLRGTRSRVPVSCITGRPTLSALPPYLVVNGRASELHTGAHNHA